MGRVRVNRLAFSLEYLQTETQVFHEMIQRDSWLGLDQTHRDGAVKGLTFIMLNLSDDLDRKEAWAMFHKVMDEYYDRCDILKIY